MRIGKHKISTAGKKGSALILTIFIMSGMLLAAMGGAYLVVLGIKASGIQAKSTKAYFTAEAGAERLLWEANYNGWIYTGTSSEPIFFGDMSDSQSSYKVYIKDFPPFIFDSIGENIDTRRSVQIILGS